MHRHQRTIDTRVCVSHRRRRKSQSETQMPDDFTLSRRRFLGAAMTTLAASELELMGLVAAQARPRSSEGSASFGPVKQIKAGVLNIGYVEEGTANGPAVV